MASHVRNLYLWQRGRSHYVSGSVVVITGAASGIGEQIAYLYAKRDSKLLLADVNERELRRVEKACREIRRVRRELARAHGDSGGAASCASTLSTSTLSTSTLSTSTPVDDDVQIFQLDVTKRAQCFAMVSAAVSAFSRLDVLVLCAGIGAHHKFEESEDESIFRRCMEINYFGYLYCVQAGFTELMRSRGLLLAITSFSGEVGLPYRTAYCSSKFAATGLLESLRAELKLLQSETPSRGEPFHITIVCPPTIDTNLRRNSLTADPKLKEAASPNALSAQECARIVVDAGDRRLRKAFFPFKSFLASYLRPLIPDAMDALIMARAKL